MAKSLSSYDPRYQQLIQRVLDTRQDVTIDFPSHNTAMSVRLDLYHVRRIWKAKLETENRIFEATLLDSVTFYVRRPKKDEPEAPIHRTLLIRFGGTGRRDPAISAALEAALGTVESTPIPLRREDDPAPRADGGIPSDGGQQDSSALIRNFFTD